MIAHSIAHRKRVERIIAMCVFPFFALYIAVATCLSCINRNQIQKHSIRLWFSRWKRYFITGWGPVRSTWGELYSLEPFKTILCYWFFLELFSTLNLFKKPANEEEEARPKIAILRMGNLGDVMHGIPALEALRKTYPKAEIHFIMGPWCASLAPTIERCAAITYYNPRLIQFCRTGLKASTTMRQEYMELWKLRRQRYSWFISSSTSGLLEWVMSAASAPSRWMGVAPNRSWYPLPATTWESRYNDDVYEAERVLRLLQPLGIVDQNPHLRLEPAQHDEVFALTIIEQNRPDHGYVLTVAPGSGWPGKNWPLEHFSSCLKTIHANYKHVLIIFIGSQADKHLTCALKADLSDRCIDLAGETSFGQAASIIRHSDGLLCNDSAPLHVAVAFDKPFVAMFGPTPPSQWVPKNRRSWVLQSGTSCARCMPWHPLATCTEKENCMASIRVKDVLDKICSLIHESDERERTP